MSKVIIIEFSDPRTSSDKPLFPTNPSKGAMILLSFSLTISSPFFTNSLSFKSSKSSFFFILKDWVFFGIAVPKLSIFSENWFWTTSVTKIPGVGLLQNFFLKCFQIIVLEKIKFEIKLKK